MHFNLQPTLQNELVILRPLEEADFEELYSVASDPLIWEQHPQSDRYERRVFELFFKDAMNSKGAFAIVDKKSNKLIGSTRFHAVTQSANAIEIGWTFLARNFWGGIYNQAIKLLMLRYAFQFVENILFHIGDHNMRSRKAVEKIGGIQITTLDGQTLDRRSESSVIYAITKQAWLSSLIV